MYIKLTKKKFARKNFLDPLSEKTGARIEKNAKNGPILDLKRAKYDRKNESF